MLLKRVFPFKGKIVLLYPEAEILKKTTQRWKFHVKLFIAIMQIVLYHAQIIITSWELDDFFRWNLNNIFQCKFCKAFTKLAHSCRFSLTWLRNSNRVVENPHAARPEWDYLLNGYKHCENAWFLSTAKYKTGHCFYTYFKSEIFWAGAVSRQNIRSLCKI